MAQIYVKADDPVHYRAIGGTVYDATVTRVHESGSIDIIVYLPGVAEGCSLSNIPFSPVPSNAWRTAYRKETLF